MRLPTRPLVGRPARPGRDRDDRSIILFYVYEKVRLKQVVDQGRDSLDMFIKRYD